jgi:hypothetical protein
MSESHGWAVGQFRDGRQGISSGCGTRASIRSRNLRTFSIMNVFELDEALVNDYERFARSFTQIRAPDIRTPVEACEGAVDEKVLLDHVVHLG